MTNTAANQVVREYVEPQEGPQTQFLSSPADIVIYGGQAGGGKTAGLLLEQLRHVNNPKFRSIIFRKTSPQIHNPGGLWDESIEFYTKLGGTPIQSKSIWRWRTGAQFKFSYMQYDKDRLDHQGAQYAFIGWDELTHFSETMFFYMLSRNRSMSGVRGYVRATCNPDPDSWVAEFIAWWIDQETGYPIPERSGVVRYMVRVKEEIFWFDTVEEALVELKRADDTATEDDVKSVTFIPASIYDNKVLLDKDPGYLSNLKSLAYVVREQLLGGNWKIKPAAGTIFKREWFPLVKAAPAGGVTVRYWDRAATEESPQNKDPDWTAGCRMKKVGGSYYIEDVSRFRATPGRVRKNIKNVGTQDPDGCTICLEKDPGQSGKVEIHDLVKYLDGFHVIGVPVNKSKLKRALPLSAQVEAGNVYLVEGPWNKAFLNEMENFSGNDDGHDDQVDAATGAYNKLLTIPNVVAPVGLAKVSVKSGVK